MHLRINQLQSGTYGEFLVSNRSFTWTTLAAFHVVVAINAVSMVFASDGEKLHINDAFFLRPLVKSALDFDALISLGGLGRDGEILPEAVFKNLKSEAQTISVGSSQKIGFSSNLSANRHCRNYGRLSLSCNLRGFTRRPRRLRI